MIIVLGESVVQVVDAAADATYDLGLLAISHNSDLQRTVSRVITGIVVPLLLGLLAITIDGRTIVIFLALVVLAHLYFEQRLAPDGHATTSSTASDRTAGAFRS